MPANREIVPVGAIDVTSALRSPVLAHARLHVGVEPLEHGVVAVGARIEQRESALLARQFRARLPGRVLDHPHPGARGFGGLRRAIAQPAHNQRIGKPGDAQADAPLGPRLLALGAKRVLRNVDDVVEKAHRRGDGFRQLPGIHRRGCAERIVHEGGEVERTEQAGPVRRSGCSPHGLVA